METAKGAEKKVYMNKCKLVLKLLFVYGLAICTSASFVYMQYHVKYSASFMLEQIKFSSFFVFCVLLFPFFGFKKVASWMFDNRWLVVAGTLLFLVLGKYHGDSLVGFDRYIQPDSGNELVNPLFGVGRPIRSDEWVVSTPAILSNEFNEDSYSVMNDVLQGRETNNAVSYANTDSILSIGSNIFTFLFGKIDVEYAFSFYWYAPLFLCFLSTIELGLIITNRNKFVSLLGGVLIAGSSWFLWWKFPSVLSYAQMAIVMGYYFIYYEKIRYKCLFGFGFSVFFSCFVCCLYPAWQIPIGYIALVFVIWLVCNNWKVMKTWRKEWFILIGSILLSVVFIGYFLYSAKEYVSAIMQTVYPGDRRDYGGMILHRMFYGFMAPLYGFDNIANPTMVSIVLSFFPIPLLFLIFYTIRNKEKDILQTGLMIVSIYLILYCSVGLPETLADITLISMSTTSKIVEILSVLQIYILMIFLNKIQDMPKLPKQVSIVFGIIYAIGNAILCSIQLTDYMSDFYMIFMLTLFMFAAYSMLAKMKKQHIRIIFGIVMVLTVVQAAYIRPVAKGLDAIYSKPLAKKIQKICQNDDEGKWLAVTDNIFLSGYMVACGASTVNSVNMYPNMDLWTKLDPEGKYETVYNRYAHIFLDFTEEETSFELVKSDVIQIHLNYNDLKTMDVRYIITLEKMDGLKTDEIEFERLYKKDGSFIYEVVY